MASDFEIAVQRLTRLANKPGIPKAVFGDLSLVLMWIKRESNIHDDLVAALKEQLPSLEHDIEELRERRGQHTCGPEGNCDCDCSAYASALAQRDRLLAALKKAGAS